MESVGDFLQRARSQAIVGLVQLLGVIVYVGMLAWTGVHNYNLLTNGVPDGMLLWSLIGVVAMELNAIALPLALHHWTFAAEHRLAAFIFYAMDLGILFVNVALDYGIVAQVGTPPQWLQLYYQWVVPATPLFAGGVWGILWSLDPKTKQRVIKEELRASTLNVLAKRMESAAKSVDIEQMVEQAARSLVHDVVAQSLGHMLVLPAAPTTIPSPTPPQTTPSSNGKVGAAVDPTRPPAAAGS